MSNKYFTKYLKEGEEVIKIVREYILSYLFGIIACLIFIILPFFLIFPLFQKDFWGVLIFFLLLLTGLMLSFRLVFIWYFNALMITNKRIIDFDQRGIFDKTVSESNYDKIQDISFKKKGFFSTIFNYGTIVIQTAGTSANLEILNVFEPEKIQALIAEIQKQNSQKEKGTKEEMTAAELVEILEQAKKKMGKEKFDDLIKNETKEDG